MVVFRLGEFVCDHEKTCAKRKCDFPYGCDLATECPEYVGDQGEFFKCEICGKQGDMIIQHTLPDFTICYKHALQVARHLLEDTTRAMFNTYKINSNQFDVVVNLIKSESSSIENSSRP